MSRNIAPLRARGYFSTLLGVGGLLCAAAVYGVAQSFGLFRTVPARLAASCGCASAATLSNTMTLIGIVSVALLVMYATVVIVRAFRTLRTTGRFLHTHRVVAISSSLNEAASVAGVAAVIREIDSAAIVAFCAGLLSPRIYVSRGAVARLDRDELRAILEHERHHLMQRDPLRLLLAELAAGLAWFVPGVRATLRNFRTTVELDADRSSIARTGTTESLGSALVKALDGVSGAHTPVRGAVTFFATTDRRIDQLLGNETRLDRVPAVLFVLIGIIVSAGLTLTTNRAVASEQRLPVLTGGQCHLPPGRCAAPGVFWSSLKSTTLMRTTLR